MANEATLSKISGPVVEATSIRGAQINELVKVGEQQLLGEIVALKGEKATIQVYEDTSGLRPGEAVERTEAPLSVELGPGLLTSIFDGIQRPLDAIRDKAGDFIPRGIAVPALDRKKRWKFSPSVKKGAKVKAGDILGTVKEMEIEHRILVPYGVEGEVKNIEEGEFTITDAIANVGKTEITMMQKWGVRTPRKMQEKLRIEPPLITGKRIVDTFFPIAKGGVAAIPGPFGSGKCVSGETPILLSDGTLTSMKELYGFCKANGTSVKTVFDETIELHKPIGLLSFKDGKIQKTQSKFFYRGKSDRLLRIRTRSGKTLEVTPTHKLFKVSGELDILETPAENLKAGEFLATPRKLPETLGTEFDPFRLGNLRVTSATVRAEIAQVLKNRITEIGKVEAAKELGMGAGEFKRLAYQETLPKVSQVKQVYTFYKLPLPRIERVRGDRRGAEMAIPYKMSEELAEFLGLYVAEGYIRGSRTVVFTNTDEALLARFQELGKKLFGLKGKVERQRGKAPNVLVSSKALAEYLKKIGCGGLAAEKSASAILSAKNADAAAFLKAYFLGDGSFSDGDIEFSTASKQLQTHLGYLLAKLGIVSTMADRKINGTPYYRVFVRGKPNLTKIIDSFGNSDEEKIAKIAAYLENRGDAYYTATDIVPVSLQLIKSAYEQAGKPYSALRSKGVEISNYAQNGEKMSARVFEKFASTLQEKAAGSQKQLQVSKLSQFATMLEWIQCDEIASVEGIDGPHDVFDVSVPQAENWIGGWGGPSILHNTVTQQDLAKYSDADIIVYVGCGERGNEMTDVLSEFPKLLDPKTKKPLMNRTVLIANTSNMPVAAREASIYTGITIAEYYRDMGYDVALMADSTSRWAEAMREISGRMEEMPGEEGYPAYLAKRLAEFYERAGRVRCLGSKDRFGSVSVIGAVSPPGGDISEPVSQATLRVTKVFWALDADLSRRRHYPAIHWLKSYSLYLDDLEKWYLENVASDFYELRGRSMALLQKEAELQNIVQLIGPDALPDRERLVLEVSKMLREDFLQQNSFEEIDVYSTLKKQHLMIKSILAFYDKAMHALNLEVPLERILKAKERQTIASLKRLKDDDAVKAVNEIVKSLETAFTKG